MTIMIPIRPVDAPPVRDAIKGPAPSPGGAGRAFGHILKDMVASVDPFGVSPEKGQPLTREEIVQLLRTLQIQMEARLWRTATDGEDGPALTRPVSFPGTATVPAAVPRQEPAPSMNPSPPRKVDGGLPRSGFDAVIAEAARTHQVDPDLIKGVIKAESNFNPRSVSPRGARGLMQLMPGTARELGVQDPHDPVENIMAGTRYLKGLLKRYGGNVPLALAAYNWGMGNVERSPDRLPAETRAYIGRVTQYYQEAKA